MAMKIKTGQVPHSLNALSSSLSLAWKRKVEHKRWNIKPLKLTVRALLLHEPAIVPLCIPRRK